MTAPITLIEGVVREGRTEVKKLVSIGILGLIALSTALCARCPDCIAQNITQQTQLEKRLWFLQVRCAEAACNFYPPECSLFSSAPRPSVLVTIAKTGEVLSSKLSRSSGISIYDQSALDAIKRAGVFKPLPKGISKVTLQIDFDLTLSCSTQTVTYVIADELCEALRAHDFTAARADVASLPNQGTGMVIRSIFAEVENYVTSSSTTTAQNIENIICQKNYLSQGESAEVHSVTAPVMLQSEPGLLM